MSTPELLGLGAVAACLLVAVVLGVVVRTQRRQLGELAGSVQRLSAAVEQASAQATATAEQSAPEAAGAPPRPQSTAVVRPVGPGDVVVDHDGRAIVVPSHAQVVDATLGRPLVRLTVLAHGVRRAWQPEHRDRVRGIMRREFRRRRRLRSRASRRAARLAVVRSPREAGTDQQDLAS